MIVQSCLPAVAQPNSYLQLSRQENGPFVKSLPTYIKNTNHALIILKQFSFPDNNKFLFQGPRSNFEIGVGHRLWLNTGGAQDTFSYELFIILKILEARAHPPPCSAVPVFTMDITSLYTVTPNNEGLSTLK